MITSKLRSILAYFSVTAGHGHTDSAIVGVKNTNGARIVTRTAQHGENLKRAYGVRWVTLEGIAKLPGGHRFPIVFDNDAICDLLHDVLIELERMKGEVIMAKARADKSKEVHMVTVRRVSELADEIEYHKLREKEMVDAIGDILVLLEGDEWGSDTEDADRYAARFILDCVCDDKRSAELNAWRNPRR